MISGASNARKQGRQESGYIMRAATAYAKLRLILSALRRESMMGTSSKTIKRTEPLAKKKYPGNNAESSDGDMLNTTSFGPFLLLKSFCRVLEARASFRRL